MELKDRIKEVRKESGLTQKEFADAIKLRRGTVAQFETGRSSISHRTAEEIGRVFGINPEWILTGEGEKYRVLSEKEEYTESLLNISELPSDNAKKGLIPLIDKLSDKKAETLLKIAYALLNEDN